MAIATYKDLCIDAVDARLLGSFWGGVLGLAVEHLDDGDAKLTGPTPQHTVWVNTVPEPKTVKHRVHLDVWLDAVSDAKDLGAFQFFIAHDHRAGDGIGVGGVLVGER